MFTIEKYPKITRGSRDIRTKNSSYWIVKDYISKIKTIIDNAEDKQAQSKLIKKMINSDVYLLLKTKDEDSLGYVLYSDFIKKHYKEKKFTYIETPDKLNYNSILVEALPKKYTGFSQITNQNQVEDFLYIHANNDIDNHNKLLDLKLNDKNVDLKNYLESINLDDLTITYGNSILPTFEITISDFKIHFKYDSNNITNVYFTYEIFKENKKLQKSEYQELVSKYFDYILNDSYLNIRKLIIVYKVKQNKYDLGDLLENWYPKLNIK